MQMNLRKLLFCFCLALSSLPALAASPAVEEEGIYRGYKRALESGARFALHPSALSVRDTRLALDAVEDLLAAGKILDLKTFLPEREWLSLPAKERARWYRLGGMRSEENLVSSLAEAAPSVPLLYELLTLSPKLKSKAAKNLVASAASAFPQEASQFRALKNDAFQPPSVAEVQSLFFDWPDIAHFQDGAYVGKPRLFLFCRHDRKYPCLLVMKDKEDKPVRDNTRALWTQPALGLSGQGKPFNERGGNTPAGVHLINGVMPEANDPESFGKFRRMILEFAPASASETEQKRLLPSASHGSLWWKESVIARDMGRSELRIHGTGALNSHPELSFYPFIATQGCVAQRELKYGNIDYRDQRLLLDLFMRSSGLEPKFENETAIKALLYVTDIDEQAAPVAASDLARFGIQ
jgi:hypothetical protein